MAKPGTKGELKGIQEQILNMGSKLLPAKLGSGKVINDLSPMPPDSGPPLPKALGLRWPWKK